MRDLLFPPECCICKKKWAYLCKICKAKLKSYPEVCTLCNKFSQDFRTCPWCKRERNIVIENILVGFYYNSVIKKLILKLKYGHRYHIAYFLAERLSLLLDIHLNHKITKENTLIVGIPSHWKRRLFTKWYNQSEILAKNLAKISAIPYWKIMKKIKNTKSQVKLNKNERIKNLESAFVLLPSHKKIFFSENKIKNIIIVDDITTTGSSLNEVAKVIKYNYPTIKCYWIVIGKK